MWLDSGPLGRLGSLRVGALGGGSLRGGFPLPLGGGGGFGLARLSGRGGGSGGGGGGGGEDAVGLFVRRRLVGLGDAEVVDEVHVEGWSSGPSPPLSSEQKQVDGPLKIAATLVRFGESVERRGFAELTMKDGRVGELGLGFLT